MSGPACREPRKRLSLPDASHAAPFDWFLFTQEQGLSGCGGCQKTSECVRLVCQKRLVARQRPTVGGEESMDKNKQSTTNPANIPAIHISWRPSRRNDEQFRRRSVCANNCS